MKNRYLTLIALALVAILVFSGLKLDRVRDDQIDPAKVQEMSKTIPRKLVGVVIAEDEKISEFINEQMNLNSDKMKNGAVLIEAEYDSDMKVSKFVLPFEYVAYFGGQQSLSKNEDEIESGYSNIFGDGFADARDSQINYHTYDDRNEFSISADLVFYQKQGLEKVYNLAKIYLDNANYYLASGDLWSESYGGTSLKVSDEIGYENNNKKTIEKADFTASSKIANFSEKVDIIEYDENMKEISRKSIDAKDFALSYRPKKESQTILVGQANNVDEGIQTDSSYALYTRGQTSDNNFMVFIDKGGDYYFPQSINIEWD